MHLVGFIIRIFYDARSHERQNDVKYFKFLIQIKLHRHCHRLQGVGAEDYDD